MRELRPLATGPVREEPGATVLLTPRTEVRVEGAQPLLRRILGCCDGRRTVAQILETLDVADRAEATALIEALLERGALCDCTQAWRVFHWQSSVESGFFRTPSEATLAEIARERYRPTVDDVHALEVQPTAVAATAAGRRSATRATARRSVGYAELGAVLSAMYGTHRPVPSAGALYPLVVHVVVRAPVGPLAPGLWWYDAERAALALVRADDYELAEVILPEATADALLAAREPVVFISADVGRPARKYANRAYRYALIELGAALQDGHLACAELGIPVRAIGGLRDGRAHDFLGLGDGVEPILAVLLGA